MSRKRSKTSSLLPFLIVCAAIAIWIYDASNQGKLNSYFTEENGKPVPEEIQKAPEKSTGPKRIGKYDVYQGCTLASDRGNDGDSFRVKFPDGKTEIVRLYFVDTPESAFKSYGGGENNHRRIEEQAEDMGSITSEQAVEIGKRPGNSPSPTSEKPLSPSKPNGTALLTTNATTPSSGFPTTAKPASSTNSW